MTTAHQRQVATLGSALSTPGPRRLQNQKAREQFDLAGRVLRMAEQRYTQRYAAMILGMTRPQIDHLCRKFSIKFGEGRIDLAED